MREGGSLTILATALVDTGSKMDDVVYEEFKSTGNMELVLDRKLSEKTNLPGYRYSRNPVPVEMIFCWIQDEQQAMDNIRKALNGMKADDAVETILNLFSRTKDNKEFAQNAKQTRFF